MEVFGMSRSPDRSFDYLKDATTTTTRGQSSNENPNASTSPNPNESISFLLDTSAIAASVTANETGSIHETGSLASTKEQRKVFYTLHDTAVSEFLSPNKSNKNNESSISDKYKVSSQIMSPKNKSNNNESNRNAEEEKPTLPTLANNRRPKPQINTHTRRSLSSTIVTLNNNKTSNNQKNATLTPKQKQIPQTPGGFWTTNTESKTFVNGLLSPFSPLLHSAIHKNTNNHLDTIQDQEEDNNNANNNNAENTQQSLKQTIKRQREEFMQYVSLQPCRKVSVVVRVTAADEDAKRCIFPHFKDDLLPSGGSLQIATHTHNNPDQFATPQGKKTTSLLPATTPHSLSNPSRLMSPTHRRDVVVVNPTAFGKYIPSQVTMETAKLVAQVANIASEDWARLYEFHHVMWPTPTKSREQAQNLSNNPSLGSPQGKVEDLASSYNTMDSLSRAVVQDLLAEHKSSLLISLGHESSCFGTTFDAGTNNNNDKPTVTSIGLWPKIMNQCAAMLETKGVGMYYNMLVTSSYSMTCLIRQHSLTYSLKYFPSSFDNGGDYGTHRRKQKVQQRRLLPRFIGSLGSTANRNPSASSRHEGCRPRGIVRGRNRFHAGTPRSSGQDPTTACPTTKAKEADIVTGGNHDGSHWNTALLGTRRLL